MQWHSNTQQYINTGTTGKNPRIQIYKNTRAYFKYIVWSELLSCEYMCPIYGITYIVSDVYMLTGHFQAMKREYWHIYCQFLTAIWQKLSFSLHEMPISLTPLIFSIRPQTIIFLLLLLILFLFYVKTDKKVLFHNNVN